MCQNPSGGKLIMFPSTAEYAPRESAIKRLNLALLDEFNVSTALVGLS
jgi:hypothetical protein